MRCPPLFFPNLFPNSIQPLLHASLVREQRKCMARYDHRGAFPRTIRLINIFIHVSPILTLLDLLRLATGLATTIKAMILDDVHIVEQKFVMYLQGASSVVTLIADCLISGSLIYFLKRPTMHISTHIALHKIITYSMNFGIVTTVMALLPLLLYFFSPKRLFLWEIFFVPAGQIYVNSIFVSLNSRRTIREHMEAGVRDQVNTLTSRYYSHPPPSPSALQNLYNIDASETNKGPSDSYPLVRHYTRNKKAKTGWDLEVEDDDVNVAVEGGPGPAVKFKHLDVPET
ncbi:hypothetical protein M422DRAFT_242927 [Sphaerobolus stellatus SS14]|nr:hypothetical protein M422DRAFT_242927 [Sphaerobolus stellatus SS14]